MRTSLDRSITKWRKIVESTAAKDLGGINCALCQEFGNGGCWYCPIAIKVKKRSCYGTPWEKWVTHQQNSHNRIDNYHREPYCRKCVALAKEELNFLKEIKNEKG